VLMPVVPYLFDYIEVFSFNMWINAFSKLSIVK